MQRPLSDEEIARKFGVTPGTHEFVFAKLISDGRVDRTICDLPDILCPHCGEEFQATYEDVRHGREMPCVECERIIWIEWLCLPPDDEGTVVVTLTTEDTQNGKSHEQIVILDE